MKMRKKYLIAVNEFCIRYNIEDSFIISLERTGLIEVLRIKEDLFIDSEQLLQIEKFIRMHNELDINLEGIETITHLLKRLKMLQDENISLRNRLSLYESADF
jgi:chaperone modulatory protein CbpM